jgi:uncharacterized protein
MRKTYALLTALAQSTSIDLFKMVNIKQLSKAWANEFIVDQRGNNLSGIAGALQRTLPLLDDPTSVPFVCRYRSDVIQPLTVPDVHRLSDMWQAHRSLASLRSKILAHLDTSSSQLKLRVETSYKKSELEDLYAPFKPPAKGSLEDRIRKENPELVDRVESFWNGQAKVDLANCQPREAVVTLLANKIAGHTPTMDALLDYVYQYARIQSSKTTSSDVKETDHVKYQTYHDFTSSFGHIRDHQVLALRRGTQQKALKMSYEIDADRAEGRIRRSLLDAGLIDNNHSHHRKLWSDAIHNAWTRLLRKRVTTRLWKDVSARAEAQSIKVFCDNLLLALLMPPAQPPRPVLALDPGFQAGIKCALLDADGQLLDKDATETVKFLNDKEKGIENLIRLLEKMTRYQATNADTKASTQENTKITVVLGNGHGSQETRDLVQEASTRSKISIDLQLVNEAGASVWSVTEGATREFPDLQPSAVAAISIGRRFQNALPELVKIPPRSLGLGMYQHDVQEKELEDKLHSTSVHAVAEVGVDGNACSLEILEKVPGLTKTLCQRIVDARPLKTRHDLVSRVSGLGPKTFENAAAFIRVQGGDEPLDATLVHPESYPLARFLLEKLQWKLDDEKSLKKDHVPKKKEERAKKWSGIIREAENEFGVSAVRVLTVLGHLIASITNPDPRLADDFHNEMRVVDIVTKKNEGAIQSNFGSVDGCSALSSEMSKSMKSLQKACPLRGVIGTVRNVIDFGAFIDFGAENDGLLHRSKMGPLQLSSLVSAEFPKATSKKSIVGVRLTLFLSLLVKYVDCGTRDWS